MSRAAFIWAQKCLAPSDSPPIGGLRGGPSKGGHTFPALMTSSISPCRGGNGTREVRNVSKEKQELYGIING
jgi:hypothetical protein